MKILFIGLVLAVLLGVTGVIINVNNYVPAEDNSIIPSPVASPATTSGDIVIESVTTTTPTTSPIVIGTPETTSSIPAGTEQGIYGTTYWVSGMERSDGTPNKAGYYATIDLTTTARRPSAGSQTVSRDLVVATIQSDGKGSYRLTLPPGSYCAWDTSLRNCFTQEIIVKTGAWSKVDLTLFGQ